MNNEEMWRQFVEKSLVIIPAHDEEECVGQVVDDLKRLGFPKVRVVDNGSHDQTGRAASGAGAEVVTLEGHGYGLACWHGALHIPPDVEWLVFCNADGSDDPEAFTRFADAADRSDLILGSRLGKNERDQMTLPQRFGNWLAPFLIRLIWQHRFGDLGPQRAIRVGAYRRLEMKDRGFGWTVEMQVRAIQEKLRITEIAVRSFPRIGGRSKISGTLRGTVLAGGVIIGTIFRLAWRGGKRGRAEGQSAC